MEANEADLEVVPEDGWLTPQARVQAAIDRQKAIAARLPLPPAIQTVHSVDDIHIET